MKTDLQREESSVSGVSTEVSRNSPVVQCDADNEDTYEICRPVPSNEQFASFPKMSLINQAPMLRITPELSISRQEMSAGQMIDSWNQNLGNDEIFYFADQKVEKPAVNIQTSYQDRSMLGKRQFEQGADMSFYVAEPSMKRHELCISNKRSLMSAGIEDQDENNLYVNNMLPALGGYGQRVGVDYMEF